jgi:hypothetical protein
MQHDTDADAERVARIVEYEHARETTQLLRDAVAGAARWRSIAIRHLHRIDMGQLPEPSSPPAPPRLASAHDH